MPEHHDARIGDVAPEVQKEIVAMAEEGGISKQELVQLWNTNPVLRHSAFQAALRDAALYRMAQRSIPRAVSRPVAQVQRPGVSEPASDRSEYAEVSREYRGKDLSVKRRNSPALGSAGITLKETNKWHSTITH